MQMSESDNEQDAEKRCCPWFDKLTMRINSLKTLNLILSLSKDAAKISCFFSSLLREILKALAANGSGFPAGRTRFSMDYARLHGAFSAIAGFAFMGHSCRVSCRL
jgi:hypothetical protein